MTADSAKYGGLKQEREREREGERMVAGAAGVVAYEGWPYREVSTVL